MSVTQAYAVSMKVMSAADTASALRLLALVPGKFDRTRLGEAPAGIRCWIAPAASKAFTSHTGVRSSAHGRAWRELQLSLIWYFAVCVYFLHNSRVRTALVCNNYTHEER